MVVSIPEGPNRGQMSGQLHARIPSAFPHLYLTEHPSTFLFHSHPKSWPGTPTARTNIDCKLGVLVLNTKGWKLCSVSQHNALGYDFITGMTGPLLCYCLLRFNPLCFPGRHANTLIQVNFSNLLLGHQPIL
jgi:hypothetical protein